MNAEAKSVSDSIDDIVSTLKFHSVALLGTGDTSFNIVKNLDGATTSVKTTEGITATNITDATNSNTTADTALTEINTSLGHVAGGMTALAAYGNISSAMASIELQTAARLMDTNFALETAKLMKNTLIQKYATSSVSKANEIEDDKRILIL